MRGMKMSKNKAYAIGVIMTVIGCTRMATSLLFAIMFSVGFVLVLYGYSDMIGHKNKDRNPYKYL